MCATSPVMVITAVIAIAFAAWFVLFVPSRTGFWSRATTVGAALSLGGLVTLSTVGRLGQAIGSVRLTDVALGTAAELFAYVAARVGYPLARRNVDSLAAAADDLFELRELASTSHMVVAIVLMGIGEELLFRGLLQPRAGLAVAVIVYAAVQLTARNVLLVVLGIVGGSVWGLLYAATGSLVAPILAHIIPLTAITVRPPAAVRPRPERPDAANRK